MQQPKIQIKNYSHIKASTPRTAEAFDSVNNAVGNMALQTGASIDGSQLVPTPPASISVQNSAGQLYFTITDQSPISRAINYYVEISSSQGFVNPLTVPLQASRFGHLLVPNGTYFVRARSQYPAGGAASAPCSAVEVTVSTSVLGAGSLPDSTGAGTGGGGAGATVTRS